MPTCLLALGANVGNRETTLQSALSDIDALPNVRLTRHSSFRRYRPVAGPGGQSEYLNAAAVVEATVPPLAFLELLERIETRHGRERSERWGPRTLDIDLLLYGDDVVETDALILPHKRMTFRRFVLEPLAEVAPKVVHPVIGWTIERLLLHLNTAKDQIVLLSPSETQRNVLAAAISERSGGQIVEPPTFKTAEQLWPTEYSTWVTLRRPGVKQPAAPSPTGGLPYAAAAFPKLTVLLDAEGTSPRAVRSQWSAIVRQPGRGPTLRLQAAGQPAVQLEVLAAIESVWPDLGPSGDIPVE
jgi:2-amino-4-hydroxy-6-hydroxymethyldihydropteridine diphosphokinase